MHHHTSSGIVVKYYTAMIYIGSQVVSSSHYEQNIAGDKLLRFSLSMVGWGGDKYANCGAVSTLYDRLFLTNCINN